MSIMQTPPPTETARAASRARARSGEGWDLAGSAPLAPDVLTEHIRHYRLAGSTASRNKVVESHLRLVAKIARRQSGKTSSFDDLMAEGALALLRAIEKFDENRGVSFTSYASVVVEHAVRAAATTSGGVVRVPTRERRRHAKQMRLESAFFAAHGRAPDAAEMQAVSDEPLRLVPCPSAATRQISLDSQAPDRAGRMDSLADRGPSPADEIETTDSVASVARALETLPSEWAEVVKMRFGIGCEDRLSPPEIAERLGISPRCVKSLLAHGMRRLHATIARSLEFSAAC